MSSPGRPEGGCLGAQPAGGPESLLVIDAGNTAVKWALCDGAGRPFVGTGAQDHAAPTDLQARLVAAWAPLKPAAVYGVSVADPSVVQAIERAVQTASGLPVAWFGTQRQFEGRGVARRAALINGYRNPAQLGADRWHALIAASAQFAEESLVVVSAGTATTVDCVQADPAQAALFLGGVIAPGFDLMRTSLARGTAGLPLIADLPSIPLAHPASTEEAIATGVFYAQLGLVENVVHEFSAELARAHRPPPRLLLGGGRAQLLLGPLTRSLLDGGLVSGLVLEQGLPMRGVALRAYSERVAVQSGGPAAQQPPDPATRRVG